ncbi:MAG: hypothetical protein KGR26_09570 [Cyanobacteria bacterium REEB65]|nr:hypothetical protein [Cyanobacteria bacterium REEB65]
MDHTHSTATWEDLETVRNKGLLSEDNPDIVAIFQQVKNLRESERSIRSLRRSLTLDNMPVLDVQEALDPEPPPAEAELGQLLDRFLRVKKEKDDLERRFGELLTNFATLQETVERQSLEIQALQRTR